MNFSGSAIFENARLFKIKKYEILFDGRKWSCTCKAGKIYKKCKRIESCKKQELFGEAKAELTLKINAAIAEFTQSYPEIQEIIFSNGEIKVII